MEWISVDDRLPDDLQIVLVHGENDNKLQKGFDVCWRIDDRWTAWWTKDITHWMPLPAPPESRENDV